MKYSFLQCGDGAVTVCFSNEISEAANSCVTEFVRIAKQKKSELVSKPANLTQMLECAKKLASGIDMVRVDLYSNGNKIWFGEMTLTPDGCIFRRWTQKAINEMGEYYRTH